MGAVAVGAVLIAVLCVIVAAMIWQEARRRSVAEPVTYLIDEAARFVYDRLREEATHRLDLDDVRRILEWGLYHTQVVAPRSGGPPPVLGSGEAIEYVMDRAQEAGFDYDPLDIAEVMAAETEYLLAIGAIGDRVEEET
jgi:hypothetical protein